jgi:small subunit ribosomal protein S9
MTDKYFEGIGRRKRSTARVRIMGGGAGDFVVNEKNLEDYFTRLGDAADVVQPLETVGQRNSLNVSVLVQGGGVTGQTAAVQLGVARALMKMNPDLKPALRKAGLLTRDSREKERKKPGLKRARKAPTYTKR